DHGLEALLPERDHIGVSLDDDGAVLLRDRGPGQVEPVEDVTLLEQPAFGRVDVLRLERIVFAQLARLEAEHAPARVGEREHDALREVVVPATVDEARGEQLLLREPALGSLLRERLPAGCEPEPERPADLLAQTAPGKILAR